MILCRSVLSLLVALFGLALSSCSTVSPAQREPEREVTKAKDVFPARLKETRLRAWQTALEITDAYEKIPAESCPGVAALVRDIREAERAVGTGPLRDLDRVDPDRLVTHNPNFWRASLEIAPSDGSLLLLHATLLAAGGEVWRANRILVATTQLLPLPPALRPYYLAQSYGLGAVILLSVRAVEESATNASPAKAVALLQNGLNLWPNNAVLLSELIDAEVRARFSVQKRKSREETGAAIEAALSACRSDIDRLFALDPVSAAQYRGPADARRKGRELRDRWARLTDSDSVLGYKEMGELADALAASEASEFALVLYRLQVAARGFPSPGDLVAWRKVLPKLIGQAPADELIAIAERGELNVVELSHGNVPGVEQWKGDPAIHPLVMQQLQREIADLSFQVELVKGNPAAEAQALRQRGVQASRAGLYDQALADLDRAMELVGRQPLMLLDEAVVHASLQHDDVAEKLLKEAEKGTAEKPMIAHERGLLRFGQGKFEEARQALRLSWRENPQAAYSAIMAELAARRIGKTEGALVLRARKELQAGSWPDLCLAFLSGKISEEVLLREAQNGDSIEVAQKLCEAYFILAQISLSAGNQNKGVDFLESCIETGITGFVEFRLARIELKRLAPEREARTRQWEEKPARERNSPPHLHENKSIEEELMDDPVPV